MSDCGVGGLQLLRAALDRHGLRNRADFERAVDDEGFANLQSVVGLLQGFESLLLNGNGVSSNRKRGKRIQSGLGRALGVGHAGSIVLGCYRSAGNHRTTRIYDCSAAVRGACLSDRSQTATQDYRERND